MAGEEKDEQMVQEIRAKYGLDQPIYVQYARWVGGAVQGNLGVSMRNDMGVTELLLGKLGITIQLALASMVIGVGIGVPLGVLAAARKGTLLDSLASGFALSGISVPNFWLGILLVLAFSVNLNWFPASGYIPFHEDPVRSLMGFVLPSIVLGTGIAATFNAVALATVNALRHRAGEAPRSLEELQHDGTIRYIAMPEALVGKYQSFTQADVSRLRAAGFTAPMQSVEEGVPRYVESLISAQRPRS